MFDLHKVKATARKYTSHGHTQGQNDVHGGSGSGKHAYLTSVYFSNWSIYQRNHFPTDIDLTLVNQVYYAFLQMDQTNGRLGFLDTWADLEVPLDSLLHPGKKVHGLVNLFRELKTLHPQLRVSFSIGGWGAHEGFEKVVSNKSLLQAFAKSCREFVEKYGFDGIDIDWEYPQNATHGKRFVALLAAVRAQLDLVGPGLRLSIAAPASDDHVTHIDVKDVDQLVDHWNLMCYDFTGPWTQTTGFHSNLFGHNGANDLSADAVVTRYLERGATGSKLILGMPLYGRKFAGVERPRIGTSFDKSQITDEGIIDYKQISRGTELFDHKKVGAFCYDAEAKMFVVFDNVQSAKIKAQYVKLHALGGGMFWDSAGDDPEASVVKAFVDQLLV